MRGVDRRRLVKLELDRLAVIVMWNEEGKEIARKGQRSPSLCGSCRRLRIQQKTDVISRLTRVELRRPADGNNRPGLSNETSALTTAHSIWNEPFGTVSPALSERTHELQKQIIYSKQNAIQEYQTREGKEHKRKANFNHTRRRRVCASVWRIGDGCI